MEKELIVNENRERTLKDDPQYFGGYLNMARLNIFNISNHIAKRFGFTILPNEERISSSFLCNKALKNADWNHIHSRTKRFLPIIKVFDAESLPKTEYDFLMWEGKNFALMTDTLKSVFSEIQEFRNDYSHFYSTEKGTIRKTKISPQLASFLEVNFKRAIEYSKIRLKDVLREEDFNLVERLKVCNNGSEITTEGLVFLICMFLEREHAFQFIGKVKGLKGTQYPSFIATRETLMSFCVKLPHDKFVSEDPKQSLILDIVNELNRCPKTLYEIISEEDRKQFRPELDIKSVDNLLKNSGKEELLDTMEFEEYMESLTKRVRHSNRFPYFALRFIEEMKLLNNMQLHIHLGKFELQKYDKQLNNEPFERAIIEDAKAFGYLKDFNDENDIKGEIVSGKDSEGFAQFSPSYFLKYNKIGIRYKRDIPHLIVDKNNSKGAYNLKQPLAKAFLSAYELPKIILMEYLQKGRAGELIDDFIQLNDNKIMTWDFIENIKSQLPDWKTFNKKSFGLKDKKGYQTEELKELNTRKNQLNKLLAPEGLNHNRIPERITDYWLNIGDVKKKRSFSDHIKLMKREGMERLKQLEKFKKEGKGKIPKVGEMATFLASDIVNMVINEERKNKITSFYYDKMQQCLALYADSEKKALFIQIIKELKLNEEGGHPFLKKIDLQKISKTSQLYELYLTEKVNKPIREEVFKYDRKKGYKVTKIILRDKSWMGEMFYTTEKSEKTGKDITIVRMPENKTEIPFTIRRWEEKQKTDLKVWFHNVTKGKDKTKDGPKAISLPTDIFDDEICTLIKIQLDKINVKYKENLKYNELLKLWWWKSREDDVQNFYHSKRLYKVYDEEINFTPDTKSTFVEYYEKALNSAFEKLSKARKKERKTHRALPDINKKEVEKVFKRAIGETEKDIRILQEEDRISILMLEMLMDNATLKLKNISYLLNDTTRIQQSITAHLSFDENGESIKEGTKPTITKTIIADRKQKNYTVLRKFIFDRRMPELFEYYASNEVALDWVTDELRAYNTAKQYVFDNVFNLEQKLIEKDETGIKAMYTNKEGTPITGNIQYKPYVRWLENKGLINKNQKRFLTMTRNCFAHNQFPQKKTVLRIVPNLTDNNIALQIADAYKNITDEILTKL